MITILAATAPSLPGVTDLVTGGGVTVVSLLVFMVIAFIRGWIITPGRFEDMRADRDAWKQAYEKEHEANLKNASVGESSLSGITTAVTLLQELRRGQTRTQRSTPRGGK